MSGVPIVAELEEAPAESAAASGRASPAAVTATAGAGAGAAGSGGLWRRVVVCGVATAGVLVAGLPAPPELADERWLAPGLVLVIVAVVALWGAAPVHRAAWRDLRDAVVSADVMASAAVLAALGVAVATSVAQALSAAGGGSPVPDDLLPALTLGQRALPAPGAALLPVSAALAAALTTAVLALRYLESTTTDRHPHPSFLRAPDGVAAPGAGPPGSEPVAGGWLVVAGVIVAAGAAGFWWAVSGPAAGAVAGVAVLVVASPCPTRLARSAALRAGSSAAGQLGIALRDPGALRRLRRVDIAVVDCTGTLTAGVPRLLRVATAADVAPEPALRAMASLLARSDDPVARAVVTACQDHGMGLSSVEVQADSGRHGVRGVVVDRALAATDGDSVVEGSGDDGEPSGHVSMAGAGRSGDGGGGRRVVTVGHEHFLRRWRITIPAALEPLCAGAEAEGHHALLAGWGGEARLVVVVADPVRPTAVAAVELLRRARVRPVVLSGDPRAVTDTAAARVGIDQVAGELDAADKAEVIRRYHRKGRTVVMLGDPSEDAAGLATADIGLAVGADVRRGDLWTVVDVVRLRRRLRRTVRTNRALAAIVPVVGIPLAAAGLLDPVLAAAATVASASFVVLNSQRLRRLTTSRPPEHRRRVATPPSTPGSLGLLAQPDPAAEPAGSRAVGQWAQAQEGPQGAGGAADAPAPAGEPARPVAANTDRRRTAPS
jgi:cation transport ATPase